MAKTKGSTAARKQNRVQLVIDLIVKYGGSNDQIKDALKKNEPNLSYKTIQRTITEAWESIQGIGSQSAEKERGLLWQRNEKLYTTESRKINPNPQLLKQHLDSGINLYKTNPHLKTGGMLPHDKTPFTPINTLSPEIESALARHSIFESDGKPKHLGWSP